MLKPNKNESKRKILDPLKWDYEQSFAQLLQSYQTHLSLLPETRQGGNTKYRIYDFAASALSVFFMQQPSFLAHQRFLAEKQQQNNLCNIFKVKGIPTDSQIRRELDKQSPCLLNGIYDDIFNLLDTKGELEKRRSINHTFLIPLDGVTYHSSYEISCKQCHRTTKDDVTHYTHQALFPTIVTPGISTVISLPPEFLTPQDGHDKQDSEIAAAKRWIQTHGKKYIPKGVTFLGDDLFAHQPFCETVVNGGAHFLLVAKPSSHKTLYEWIEPLFETKYVTSFSLKRRKGKKQFLDTYRFINQVPLRDSEDALQVNWCELVTTNSQGKIVYRNSFITDHVIDSDNVVDIVKAGRARWKVENENHNTLKTKGYHLSHNFGHGKQFLAQFLTSLNVLAFLFHTTLELFDAAYRTLRLKTGRRDSFFQSLAVLTRFHVFNSWGHLMRFMVTSLEIPFLDSG